MKNFYFVAGQDVWIELHHHGNVEWTCISKKDLERANEFHGTWCIRAILRSGVINYYVVGKIYHGHLGPGGNGGGKTVYLHRWLLHIEDPNVHVDHRDNNPLNNMRSNLRKGTRQENLQRRRLVVDPSRKNKSGVPNVCRNRSKWQVVVARKYLGRFSDLEDAKKAAEKARQQINLERLKEGRRRKPKSPPQDKGDAKL